MTISARQSQISNPPLLKMKVYSGLLIIIKGQFDIFKQSIAITSKRWLN